MTTPNISSSGGRLEPVGSGEPLSKLLFDHVLRSYPIDPPRLHYWSARRYVRAHLVLASSGVRQDTSGEAALSFAPRRPTETDSSIIAPEHRDNVRVK